MTETATKTSRAGVGLTGRRVAVLDMNDGVPNLGLGAIVDAVETFASSTGDDPISVDIFDVRGKAEIPNENFDVFISSGGPGSPFDGQGENWEASYFDWLERVRDNHTPALLICHSFELMIRHFGLAAVTRRRSPSFGIFPVHPTAAARYDPVLKAVDDPFYAADFRNWQVVEADRRRLKELDARILAREKVRPHVDLERAIMAVRVGRNMLGVQFHPEASPEGMALHFLKDERMKIVTQTHGADTFDKMLKLLEQPKALAHTHATVIPRFLNHAFADHD